MMNFAQDLRWRRITKRARKVVKTRMLEITLEIADSIYYEDIPNGCVLVMQREIGSKKNFTSDRYRLYALKQRRNNLVSEMLSVVAPSETGKYFNKDIHISLWSLTEKNELVIKFIQTCIKIADISSIMDA